VARINAVEAKAKGVHSSGYPTLGFASARHPALRKDAGYLKSPSLPMRVHRTYMGAVERGETNISLDNIERIARGLRLTPRSCSRSRTGAIEFGKVLERSRLPAPDETCLTGSPHKVCRKVCGTWHPVPSGPRSAQGAWATLGRPNAGRPRNGFARGVSRRAREGDGIGFIARVMRWGRAAGVGVDKHGRPVLARPRIRDRLHAAKLLIEHGYGKGRGRRRSRTSKPPHTREELVAHIVKMLPRVLPLLPLDGQELAPLAGRAAPDRAARTGKEIKEAGTGTETPPQVIRRDRLSASGSNPKNRTGT